MSQQAGRLIVDEEAASVGEDRRGQPRAGPIVVVVNARAGLARKSPEVVRTLSRLIGARGRVELTSDLDDLGAVVTRARSDSASMLASCGGDGSHMRLLSAVARLYGEEAWPRFVVLPGGTMNTAARNLGCARRPEVVLRAVLDGGGRTRTMRLLRVGEHVGFVAGLGFVATLMQRYYDTMTGHVGTALLAARVIASAAVGGSYATGLFQPVDLSAALDGAPVERATVSGVLASVVPVPTLGIRATHRAGEEGRLHLVAAARKPRSLLNELPRLWLGLPVRSLAIDRTAETAEIETPEPIAWTLDGDMFEGRRWMFGLTSPVTFVTG